MRIARSYTVAPSGIYHVYSRGVDKRVLFHDARDCERFLKRLHEYSVDEEVVLLQGCLMVNHFHLLVSSESIVNLSRLQHRLLTAYATYYNRRYQRSGHLFQGRFQSRPVTTETYYQQLAKYIDQNPRDGKGCIAGRTWILQGQASALQS